MPVDETKAIITLKQAKDYLKVDYPEDDELLADLINRATDYLEKVKYKTIIKQREVSQEKHDGTGKRKIYLKNYPVSSITSLTVDGVPFNDYVLYGRIGMLITQDGSVWRSGRQNIVVDYVAGYDPVPEHFVQECLELVAAWYEGRGGTE
jgi:uncharacterized phiE125 gp8 family phage protein